VQKDKIINMLKTSRRDDSNKRTTREFGEEMGALEFNIRFLSRTLRRALLRQMVHICSTARIQRL